MKSKLLILISVVALAAFAAASRFVWIGDVLSGRTVVVGRIQLPEDESVELVQRWNHDGYTTFVRHRSNSEIIGQCAEFETIKAWHVSMRFEPETKTVRMKFNGKEWKHRCNARIVSKVRT